MARVIIGIPGVGRYFGNRSLKLPRRVAKANPQTERISKIGNSIITIGKYTYGIENINVYQWNEGAALNVGRFCSLGHSLDIYLGGNHRLDWVTTFPFGHIFQKELGQFHILGHPQTNGNVEIGNDVWIGGNVTLMSGIKIGDGCVVAAKSVVTTDVPPYSIVGGNPARKIRDRFSIEIAEALLNLQWWMLPDEKIIEIVNELSQEPSLKLIDSLNKKYVE